MMHRKMMKTVLAALLILGSVAFCDDRSMSLNTEVKVVPAPGAVVIDGKDDDWDLSAGVFSYNDPTIIDRYSLWTHLMWDAKGVYFLARYNDATPMKNNAAGKDFHLSWQADCFQARVIFDDGTKDEHQMHVNMYYATPDQKALMIIKHGGFKANPPYDATGPDRPDQLERFGPTMDAAGGSLVIRPWDDGKGYNMEAFWPWSYCRTNGQALAPGEKFTFGIEAMWGNATGTRLTHRLADGITDDTVNRIFMFRARNGWGKAVITDKGGLSITQEQIALQKNRLKNFMDFDSYGSVDIAYDLSEKQDVTIAIDDAAGKRVRNLFGQYPREPGKVVDKWDCLDDTGNPVAPGTYTATVLHHKPVELKLYNSVYSSATPPWPTEDGTKLWGSNHGHPTSVATRGEVTVLFFTGTEGGSGIQRIDDNGTILWTDGNEFLDGTIDESYAYGLSRSSWQNKTLLFRFRLTDGHLTPFEDVDRSPSPTLLPDQKIPSESSMALAHGALWVFVPGRTLLQVNPATGAVVKEHPVSDIVAVTDRAGLLYTLEANGTVATRDAEMVGSPLFTVTGLGKPTRLGVSQDQQRFSVSDSGNNQVCVVDAKGKLLTKIGRAYEGKDRPAGAFQRTDLIQPMGTGFDHLGRLWIPEGVKSCKRVTCWNEKYEIVDQFWGQADYGAMSGFPLTFDATRFIAHGIEFKLDPEPNPLVRKTREEALFYHPDLAHDSRGLIYQFNGHEYACGTPGFNKPEEIIIFKRNAAGVFTRVVVITLAGRRQVDGKWVDHPGRAWTDRNEDGREGEGEIAENLSIRGLYWSNGWIRPDLVLMSTTGDRYDPTGFTEGGVPLYDFTKPVKIANWIQVTNAQGSAGTPIMDRAGNISDGIFYHTVDGRTGAYPNPYGRHDAPAAQRGLLIAPFRTNGVVEDVPGVGSITALGGDRGEWFLMSMDGLYISSLCQDSKGSVILDDTFIGQESFGGFIWRDTASGRVLVQLGGPSYRLMEVRNLDTCIRRTQAVEVTEETIRDGMAIAQKRQQQEVAEPDTLRVCRINRMPEEAPAVAQPASRALIKGATDLKVVEKGNPARAFRAALAHNGRDLAVAWQVSDDSPWKNGAGQFTHAFIGGDAVDLQLDVPGRGTVRLLVAKIGEENTVVYWQSQAEDKKQAMTYVVQNNESNATRFDSVKRLESAKVQVVTGPSGYSVLLQVPMADLGLDKAIGQKLTGMIGVIYSDPSGTNRAMRLYWHNKKTGLVSDVPSEARLEVKNWGQVHIDE